MIFLTNIAIGQQQVTLETVAENFNVPVDIAFDHKNVMYVVEKKEQSSG